MAAAQAAFTNYLNASLGFDAELRQNIVDQGVDTMEELERMPLKDLDDMFAKIRSPGGTVANPAFVAGGDAAARLRNYGCSVSLSQARRLKLLCQHLKHLARTSRPFVPATIVHPYYRPLVSVLFQDYPSVG